ncbi:type II secretion system protein GspL [Vibrio sp. S4M6]|uniref:type II secretion system protein GspL n=1 Tax=Vibrio sinus TaxID=2946865 RepID=UPI002029E3EA|nr:type II secretion system protein GspL [Vibrio sinus]
MSECLIVRLSSQTTSAIPWLVWSNTQQQVVESGELATWENISEIQQIADQRQVVILLAANDVILSEVEIPAGASRQLDGLIPYLLEDDVAQDVDELHFSVLDKKGQQAVVCGVNRAWLDDVLEQLRRMGVEVKRVLPEILALPSSDELTGAYFQGQWLVKKGDYLGLAVDPDWLEVLKDSDWVKEDDRYLSLTAYSSLPDMDYASEQEWCEQENDSIWNLLASQASQSSITLLTGAFKPKSALLRHWKVWQKSAISAAVLIVIVTGYNLLKVNEYENQAAAYRAESERIFHQIFPNKRRIPTMSYLKRLMEDEVQRLSGADNQASMLAWLNKLPETVESVPGMELQSIKYDSSRGELRIEASSKDFQSFEKARIELQKQFKVQEGQLGRDGDVVSGTFLLTKKGG